jgi:thiol-disulfide isomerase/thioredoxin
MTKRRPAVVALVVVAVLAVAATLGYWQLVGERGARGEGASAAGEAATVAGSALPIQRGEKPRPLPELRFIDADSKPRSLAEFRGRVVLLNIWATWCVPCREEMPALDRLQSMLGGPGFEVVALSIDRDGLPKVRRFYDELGLKALRIYVASDSDVTAKLGAVGIPLTLLVDRDGNELWRKLGPAEWDQPASVDLARKEIGEATK